MAKKTATKKAETKKADKTKKAAKAPAKKAAPKKPAAQGPLTRMKAKYGSKDKLVDAIAGSLATDADDTGTLKDRLLKASNQQLLRLANVVESVKKTYGSRDKLIDSLAKALNKAKDKDYLAKLGSFSLPQLYDLARAAERRVKARAAK
ncbi:MAG TPA: hypothetical protein VM734_03510 [Kofleriaceae bacterium]|jgi:hypothetical protein|nr:hypothetical protein [Kofleriaceae bacterium]